MNHDNNLNRSSDNESHPGKNPFLQSKFDPVNVRPASIPTPPQHSSTTSVASLVSEVISHPPKSVCGAPTDMCETEEKETKKEQPVKAESVPCSAKTKKEEKELNNSENTNSKGTQWCPLCQSNKRPENEYRSHCLRDNTNRATCPILRERTCRLCNATGDSAHNEFFCPTNVSEQGERLSANSTAEIEQSLQQLRLATENEDNKHAKTTSDVAESEPVDTEPEHVSVTESEQGSVKAASSIVPPSSSMITTTEPHPKMEFTQKVWVNSAYQKKSQYNRSRGGHHKNAENNGSTSQHKTKEHNSSSGTDNNASRRRRGGHRNAQKSTPTTTTKNTSNQ
ncbi:hypothetical protein L596_000024 [Steinernema carpocapsae]|nr:hypothetical protein L596_000024 [Steinernema carpocapsae]